VSWRVIIRPNAEADLQEARSWYESRRAGLGDELLDEIRRVVRWLEEEPERRPFYYRDFRRLLTRRFPYKLFYRVEGDRVIVFRIVAHATCKPFAGGLHRSRSVGLTAFAVGKSFSPFPKWLKSQAAQVTRGKTYGRSVEPIK
jgi:plasmid stabilization system protein ParE